MLAVAAATTMLIEARLNAGYDCSSYLSDYATAGFRKHAVQCAECSH